MIFDLIEEDEKARNRWLYSLGKTFNLAFNAPEKLERLIREPFDPSKVTGMLKPVRKKPPE